MAQSRSLPCGYFLVGENHKGRDFVVRTQHDMRIWWRLVLQVGRGLPCHLLSRPPTAQTPSKGQLPGAACHASPQYLAQLN